MTERATLSFVFDDRTECAAIASDNMSRNAYVALILIALEKLRSLHSTGCDCEDCKRAQTLLDRNPIEPSAIERTLQ